MVDIHALNVAFWTFVIVTAGVTAVAVAWVARSIVWALVRRRRHAQMAARGIRAVERYLHAAADDRSLQ